MVVRQIESTKIRQHVWDLAWNREARCAFKPLSTMSQKSKKRIENIRKIMET